MNKRETKIASLAMRTLWSDKNLFVNSGNKNQLSRDDEFIKAKESIIAKLNSHYDVDKDVEDYLFKIARSVLFWAGVEYKENELTDLVMQNLIEIK